MCSTVVTGVIGWWPEGDAVAMPIHRLIGLDRTVGYALLGRLVPMATLPVTIAWDTAIWRRCRREWP